jgi:hypothetical protein
VLVSSPSLRVSASRCKEHSFNLPWYLFPQPAKRPPDVLRLAAAYSDTSILLHTNFCSFRLPNSHPPPLPHHPKVIFGRYCSLSSSIYTRRLFGPDWAGRRIVPSTAIQMEFEAMKLSVHKVSCTDTDRANKVRNLIMFTISHKRIADRAPPPVFCTH